jgi:hypothetical protein
MRYEKPSIFEVGKKKAKGKTFGISRGVSYFILILNDISNYHKLNQAIIPDHIIIEFLLSFKKKVTNIL